MNKKDLKAKLDAQGIAYEEDATNAELEALLPPKEEGSGDNGGDNTPPTSKAKKASVYSEGRFVRAYTPEDTDENRTFEEKAECYANKIGGTFEVA